ncbi:MAG: transposase [Bacteroidales bacterium]|nr:transposase [Bacteroidales bacterium]
MFQDKFIFAQLTSFLDRNHFNYLVRKYDGDRYVKSFTCWNQLMALMFGQLCNRESLRDVVVALEAHQSKCYHLGMGRNPIAKTTFATSNQNRDYRIFEDFAFFMMEQARIRAKKNLQYKCTKWKCRLPKNVLTDSVIELTDVNTQKKYPERLRLVRFHDDEQDRDFAFLTNAFHLTSLEIANLYKNRWQIELFFKWLKQHLKIKKFWGTAENAVRIQICSAIITYSLVAIVQHNMQLKRSSYEVLQILSISLTDKTTLRDLFEKTNFNDVKELDYPLFEGLFD